MIHLKNSHLFIDATTVQQAFGNDPQVSVVYYPDRKTLLLAGKSKAFFEKLHETNWVVLKDRNLLGDKTVYLREILIDNDIDDTDRELVYDLKTTGIVAVTL